MKSEAIRCAIKLHAEPSLLARFDNPSRRLPRGITELLRIVSSNAALNTVSIHNNLDEHQLKSALIHYIQLILLKEKNSDLRKLGLDPLSNPNLYKLHYKLLMNIFHPDKSGLDPCFSKTILRSYKSINKNQKTNLSPSFKKKKQTPHYKQLNDSPLQSKVRQINSFIKHHFILSILSFSLLVFIIVSIILSASSSPRLIIKKELPSKITQTSIINESLINKKTIHLINLLTPIYTL